MTICIRLCEVLEQPRKYFFTCGKLLRALEKLVFVSSRVLPAPAIFVEPSAPLGVGYGTEVAWTGANGFNPNDGTLTYVTRRGTRVLEPGYEGIRAGV